MVALAAALSDNTHLATLNASGKPLTDVALAAIATMLRVNTGLRSLAIGDKELGDTGLAALLPGLTTNRTLTRLDLSFKGLTEAAAASLETLSSASTAIETLVLARNQLGDVGAKAFFAGVSARVDPNPLRVLVLTQCRLSSAAVSFAADSWHRLSCVTELVLSSNALGSAGGVEVAKLLTGESHLESLELNQCELGAEGVNAIASAAAECVALRQLHLGDNSVPASSVEVLCKLISTKKGGFATLSLRNNPGLAENDGIGKLAVEVARPETAVGSLNLSQCGVSPLDLPALLTSSSLEELHVNCNDLSAGLPLRACQMGADASIGPGWLQRATGLKVLDVSGSGLPDSDCLLLLDTLTSELAALPALEMLGLGGEPEDRSRWQDAIDKFRTARPTTMVAWT